MMYVTVFLCEILIFDSTRCCWLSITFQHEIMEDTTNHVLKNFLVMKL